MSIFRSYFSKNNTLIANNFSNNSQNPVTEISYGTNDKQVSRFIFDVDLDKLATRISQGFINPNNIVRHTLHMTNSISYAPQYIGKKSYSESIQRASSFELEVFNLNEDWDEGSGYSFIYNDYNDKNQASNWFSGKTGVSWLNAGAFAQGVNEIIGSQRFEKGNENIDIDITDYVNQRLFVSGHTGYTGTSYGLGIKMLDIYEEIATTLRQAVAFHAKNTNTWYEPYIETEINDRIVDDRNYFYLDKDNELYLYVNTGGYMTNVIINAVRIYDNDDNHIITISGDSIIHVGKGIYKALINLSSEDYPDSVLFSDEWDVTINEKNVKHISEFYLISSENYYSFNNSSSINFDNYYFYFSGINERENIKSGGIRKIKIGVKELYVNQNNFVPLEIEYRVFTTVGSKYEIDVIPYTPVNRTNSGYEFNLDSSWLIPQDYRLQIRMKNGDLYANKETLSFTVVSNDIISV